MKKIILHGIFQILIAAGVFWLGTSLFVRGEKRPEKDGRNGSCAGGTPVAAPAASKGKIIPEPAVIPVPAPPAPKQESHTRLGIGYVRGERMVTLRNRYAGFVNKVNFYDHDKVRKGDVILEYDDLDWRERIINKQNDIAELEKSLKQAEVELARVMLDPLPDTFRNLQERRMAAESKLRRLTHEDQVYQKLRENQAISDLAQREKHQDFLVAQAEYNGLVNNQKKLENGLSDLYVQKVQQEVDRLKTQIEDYKRELALMQEARQYYRITAPWDGICITHSGTICDYNPEGTAAAEVHGGSGKLVYAYVGESRLERIILGKHYRFRSYSYDNRAKGFAELEAFNVAKEHRGDKYLVKFRVVSEPVPLLINSTGQVEEP